MSISSQGNIKTRGSLVVGGEASGTKIWALNANAKKWKIKYGDNSSEHDFFGVALPSSTSEWGQGIRFNGGYKSVLLNGSGIRFYDWGVKSIVTNEDGKQEKISGWNLKHTLYGNDTSFYFHHKYGADDNSYLAFNSKDGIYFKKDKDTPYIHLDFAHQVIYMYSYDESGKKTRYKVALTPG